MNPSIENSCPRCAVPTFVLGPWLAGKIYGLNLMLSCRFFDINHNDAFSAMKLDSYRHFLRIRVRGNEVAVYPIKLENVPAREHWRENKERNVDPLASLFVADPPLRPELIEEPVVVQVRTVASTTDVKTPGELPSQNSTPKKD